MATSFGPGSPASSNSYSDSSAWNQRSYSTAALRAGLIALALLVVLAFLVLS